MPQGMGHRTADISTCQSALCSFGLTELSCLVCSLPPLRTSGDQENEGAVRHEAGDMRALTADAVELRCGQHDEHHSVADCSSGRAAMCMHPSASCKVAAAAYRSAMCDHRYLIRGWMRVAGMPALPGRHCLTIEFAASAFRQGAESTWAEAVTPHPSWH